MNRLLRAGLAAVLISPMITAASVVAAPAAVAEANGVGQTPAMGWSSWSYIRHNPTAADIEAQAAAMKTSGLASAGYDYVNIDDFWYGCPGSQGPDIDSTAAGPRTAPRSRPGRTARTASKSWRTTYTHSA